MADTESLMPSGHRLRQMDAAAEFPCVGEKDADPKPLWCNGFERF